MALFRCKMCGGSLEVEQGASVATCEYCGTQQTLPRLDDERKANLYDRANHFRRNNEYDKASGIYEQILNEDHTDAESYWSLVLCRFGIEYVEDPASHKRIPTVNRAQYTSIFDDENYKFALRYADDYQKAIYEEEARTINEIQRGILAISQKEEPFDVFICYKETDNNGRRTPDSVLANDLYHQLTQEGFKVFFSRITLEDKLGVEYEPYIFAALNSSQVMVVMGTRPEYFNAPWVRNEWSRFLILIKNGEPKTLIPAYRDMNPYDLPEEFSQLQALDMSRLGFMQDLIRGIKKITGTKVAVVSIPQETSMVVSPLLRRAFLFLEDGDWQNANEYCEKVLDQEPENGRAYLGLLMIALKVCKESDLEKLEQPFDDHPLYKKAVRFGDAALVAELTGYNQSIRNRIEFARLEAERLERERLEELRRKAEEERLRREEEERKRKEARLQAQQERERKRAEAKMRRQAELLAIQIKREKAEEAKRLRKQELEQKKEQATAEKRRLAEETKQRENTEQTQKKKLSKQLLLICAAVLVIGGATFGGIKWKAAHDLAVQEDAHATTVQLLPENKYEDAIAAFAELGELKDSDSKESTLRKENDYSIAVTAMKSGDYEFAMAIWQELGDYRDAASWRQIAEERLECQDKLVGSWSKKGYGKTYDFFDSGTFTETKGSIILKGTYKIVWSESEYDLKLKYQTTNMQYQASVEWVSDNEIILSDDHYFRTNESNATATDVNTENHQAETVTEDEVKLQEYLDHLVGTWSGEGLDKTYTFNESGSFTEQYGTGTLITGIYKLVRTDNKYYLRIYQNGEEAPRRSIEFVSDNEIVLRGVHYFKNNGAIERAQLQVDEGAKLQEYQDKLVGSWAIGSSRFVFYADGTFVEQYDTTIRLKDTYQVKWSGKRYYLHTTVWHPMLLEFVSDNEIVLSGTAHYFRINDDTTTTTDVNTENHQAETITEAESKLQEYQDKLVGSWSQSDSTYVFEKDGSYTLLYCGKKLKSGSYRIVRNGKKHVLCMDNNTYGWNLEFVSHNEIVVNNVHYFKIS